MNLYWTGKDVHQSRLRTVDHLLAMRLCVLGAIRNVRTVRPPSYASWRLVQMRMRPILIEKEIKLENVNKFITCTHEIITLKKCRIKIQWLPVLRSHEIKVVN